MIVCVGECQTDKLKPDPQKKRTPGIIGLIRLNNATAKHITINNQNSIVIATSSLSIVRVVGHSFC